MRLISYYCEINLILVYQIVNTCGGEVKNSTVHLSATNCYLLKNAKKYILIDTGYVEDGNYFKNN